MNAQQTHKTPQTLAFKTCNWEKDKKAESILSENGIVVSYDYVPISHINLTLGKRNHSRLDVALDQDQIAEMQRDMDAGDIFPAVVLHETNDAEYAPVGGNHRLNAANNNEYAYVYAMVFSGCNQSDLNVIAAALNAKEGRRSTTEDRTILAADHCEQTGLAATVVAKNFRVKAEPLRKELTKRTVMREATRCGRPLEGSLNASIYSELAQHLGQPPIFKAMCSGVIALDCTATELKEIRQLIQHDNTERDKLQTLEKEFIRLEQGRPKRQVGKPTAASLRRCYHGLFNLLEKCSTVELSQLEPQDLKELRERWNSLPKWFLSAMQGGGDTPSTSG
jgi:hypothetical protein